MELENLDQSNRGLAFWAEVKNTLGKKGGKNTIGVIKNKRGELSDSQESFLENWASFYENLYRASESSREFAMAGGGGPQALNFPPTLEELELELKSAAKNKAPGLDGIRIEELSTLSGTSALPVLGKLLELFWELEKVPSILKKTILVPLLKKPDGDVHDPANYRPIALMSNLLRKKRRFFLGSSIWLSVRSLRRGLPPSGQGNHSE